MAEIDYGDKSIKTLSGIEHYRFRPSMYGFQISNVNGLQLMVKEVVDNSTDESNIDPSRVYTINVTFFVSKDRSTFQCLVQDFGRGIPVGKLVDCLATANTSGKYEDKYGAASTGTNGVGSKVVAALSKQFIAFTKRRDGFASLEISKGKIKDSTMTRKPIDKDRSTDGTTVLFQPDEEIMAAIPDMFKMSTDEEMSGFDQLIDKMGEYSLFHRNSMIIIRVVDGLIKQSDLNKDPEEVWRYLTNLDNFKFVEKFRSDLSLTPRSFVMKKFGIRNVIWELPERLERERDPKNPEDRLGYYIDVFTDEKTLAGEGGLIGAVNTTPISDPNSIHLTMLQNVMKMYLIDFILDKDKKTFFETRYVLPLSGYVSAIWVGASFDGQDKSKFTDHLFGDFYRTNIRRQLNKVPESSWERLFELMTDNFEMAYAKYSKSQYKMNKNLKGIGYMLKRSGSYVPCVSNDSGVIEIFITEGDSAAGRVKTVRNEETQALFKLSGKPINAERADAKALIKNAIYQDLMELIGVRPTDTDLSNMRFKQIIILTDADPDGYHIATLLIGILKSINPKILEEGRVSVANPPLYSFRVQGQKRPLYLRDQSALMDMKTEIYRRMIDIYYQYKNEKERALTGPEYSALCAVVEHIGDVVKFNADQLNLDPYILEQLLYCVDYLGEGNVNVKKIKEILKDAGVENVIWDRDSNSIILVTQGFDRLISLSHLQSTMKNTILPLYDRYDWEHLFLFVSTRHTDLYVHAPCSFMMLYSVFKNITGNDNGDHFALTRFKGLGEMSEEDILGTCVDPLNRRLSRIFGMGDVQTIYDMLGVDSEARKQLTTQSVRGRLINNGFLDEES